MEPKFFETPAEFRAWLEKWHDKKPELWVGLYKKSSGRPSITWPEVVDQALCFGWIDGIRKSIDDESYMNRVTPRRSTSTWSAVNIKRFQELANEGLVHPAGAKAFEARREGRIGIYSYEQRDKVRLAPEFQRRFESEAAAWEYWMSRPPSYRKAATWWVMSAKRPETRERRFATLLADSSEGRPIKQLA